MEGSVHHQAKQLLACADPVRPGLRPRAPHAYVYVTREPAARLRQPEGEHIGGTGASLVALIEAPHPVAPDERHGDGGTTALTAEDSLDRVGSASRSQRRAPGDRDLGRRRHQPVWSSAYARMISRTRR